MIDSLRLLFMHWNRDSKDQIAICRWHIAATSSKTGCHLNFCPSHARTKMQTSPFRCTKQIRGIPIRVSLLFVSPSGQEGTRRVQCNSPVDCCRRGLDRAEPLSAPLGSRCKRVLLRFPVCALPTAGLRCTQAAATRSGRCICPRQRSLRSPFR